MARLLLMRHAKAEPGGDDHGRALTARGRRDAEAAGRRLAAGGLVPDLVLCSDSVRTRQTAELVLAGYGLEAGVPDPTPVADLYGAGPQRVLDLVVRTPPEVGTLLVVGHEPTTSALVAALTGRHVPFPTSTVAVIEPHGTGWDTLTGGSATLLSVHVPERPGR